MLHVRAALMFSLLCLVVAGCGGERAKSGPIAVVIYPTATLAGGGSTPTSISAPDMPTSAPVAAASPAATGVAATSTPRVIVVTATVAPAVVPTATSASPKPPATTAPPPPPPPTATSAPTNTPAPPPPTRTPTPPPIPLEQRRFVGELVGKEKTNELLSKIQGTVVDKNGKGIAGVVVELKDVAINGQITNADGWFLFQFLSNNTYKVNLRNFTNCEPAIVTTDNFQMVTVRLREAS